jgi:hypothetical protein
MSYNLPDGCTDRMIDEAFGGNPRCVCGDLWDDHSELDASEDPQVLLGALKNIDTLLKRRLNLAYPEIAKILDTVLTVCQVSGCTCRKFEEER